jgi:ABC-type dipeptide/oligopeptide/nickel transport system permease subunit
VTYVEASPHVDKVELRPGRSFRTTRRLIRRPVAVVALIIIITIYAVGILAPWIAPEGFATIDLQNRYSGPTWEHPLGADELGRDILSRIIWSTQTTVIVSVAAMLFGSLALGVTLGLISGYAGGRTDSVIMRLGDAFYSVPTILLLLIIIATMQDRVDSVFRDIEDFTGFPGLVSSGAPRYFLVFGALAIFGWVGMARLVRSQVLSLRESAYVLAARAAGASHTRILFWHLLPNITNLMIVVITISLGAAAAAEIGLTFLGVGVQAPHPSFGVMISDYAQDPTNIRDHPTLILYPALVIGALVLSFNLLGDVLTDVMSPRRR